MSHMVIFRTAEGKASYQQAEALEEAVRFVERLRNEESVEHARIFRLEEVGFEFKPFFRVELTGARQRAGDLDGAAEPANGNGDRQAVDGEEGRAGEDGHDAEDASGEEAAAEDGRSRRGLFR